MHVSIDSVRVGRTRSAEWDALTGTYLQRFGGSWRADTRVFRSEAALLEQRAADLRGGAAALWLLDGGGEQLSSEAWAAALEALRETGVRRLSAAIGPADGWSRGTLDGLGGRDRVISLGPLTLPHELARLVVAEQMYRAVTILSGHPYHLGHASLRSNRRGM